MSKKNKPIGYTLGQRKVDGAELVQRDRLVVLVLVVEGVEAGGDGI